MKLEQYLNEALATEMGLVRQLQAQLTMTPEGSYRSAVERHLGETRSHAERVQKRIGEIGGHENPWVVGLNVAETVAAQWLALAKTPWDMMRGTGIEEKVLKNAKDSAAAEALEIATYEAIEHLARVGGDEETAALAAEIRADEERMLADIRAELTSLVEAVAHAEAGAEHGGVTVRARAAVRRRRGAAPESAASAAEAAPAGEPQFAPQPASGGPAAPAGEPTPAPAASSPVAAADITGSAPATPESAPSAAASAPATSEAPSAGGEPWAGYDGQNVRQITARLSDADGALARAVVEYERTHKNRSSVIAAAQKHT
jgi:ferritin-like metal-binding protein YciE